MFTSGRTADEIVSADGLTQIDDESHIRDADRERDASQSRRGQAVPRRENVDVRVPRRPGDEGGVGKANPKRVNESLKRALDALETENAN